MLEAALVTLLVGGLGVFLPAFFIKRYRREWAGIWSGRRFHIIHTFRSLQIHLDGELLFEQKKIFNSDIDHQFTDDLNGECELQLVMKRDSNGQIAGCQLVVNGEIVHLAQAPVDWTMRSISDKLPQLKEVSTVEGQTITDPRWMAALRLFETLKAEVGQDEQTAELVEALHHELKENILIAQRLIKSKEDYAALGNDGGQMDAAQSVTEEKIQKLLTALQDLHLAVVQRNISSGGPVLSKVQNLLAQLQADTEVEESFSSSLSRKQKKHLLDQTKKKL